MRYTVVEPFNSLTRRFDAGVEIDEAEIDGPVPVARWVEMGKIRAVEPIAAPVDFASEQGRLRAAWDADRNKTRRPEANWTIYIEDQALFGIVSAIEANAVVVNVPGEEEPRRYPLAAMAVATATVAGPTIASPRPSVADEPIRSRIARVPVATADAERTEPSASDTPVA